MSQDCWRPFQNTVRPPKEFAAFKPFNKVLLEKTNTFANTQLGFSSSIGFQGGSHALNYESCLMVMEAMQVTSESRVLEYG
jgi:hypothetical protein